MRERHAPNASQLGLAQLVRGSLGALLIGAGLIAVIGYNWDAFSRPVRLLFAFLPLLLTQVFGFRVLQRGDACAAWVLRSHAMAIFYLVTTAIWSVNQVAPGRPWHDSPLNFPLLLLGLLPYWQRDANGAKTEFFRFGVGFCEPCAFLRLKIPLPPEGVGVAGGMPLHRDPYYWLHRLG